jgi:hypothetical protein
MVSEEATQQLGIRTYPYSLCGRHSIVDMRNVNALKRVSVGKKTVGL